MAARFSNNGLKMELLEFFDFFIIWMAKVLGCRSQTFLVGIQMVWMETEANDESEGIALFACAWNLYIIPSWGWNECIGL